MSILRVAAVQAAPAFLDLAGTLALTETLARKAAGDGAAVVAFSETWLPGYPIWLDASPGAALWNDDGARSLYARLLEQAVEVPGPAVARLGRLSRELGITLVVGAHERAGRSLYNALLTWGPDGELLNHHRKLVPTHGERLVWGYGDGAGLRAVEVNGVRVGGLICWEHWMPLARQALHDAGEHLHVAAWPGIPELYQVASRHYAFEGRCFVLAVGQLLRLDQLPPGLDVVEAYRRHPKGLVIAGGSAVIAPDGRYVAGPVYDDEALVIADCDLAEIPRASLTLDVSGHYSRPDVFDLRVHRGGRPPRGGTG